MATREEIREALNEIAGNTLRTFFVLQIKFISWNKDTTAL